jgi:phosphoglycerate dehydrogenase-like enzyme
MSATPQIVYIGAPEADACAFETRARADFTGLALLATNDRPHALQHLGGAEAVIGHHFQFDEELLSRAPRLRWIQSLTTGTDAILKLDSRHAWAADVRIGISVHARTIA